MRDYKNNRSTRSEMHKTVCSKCGKRCQVPFKPSQDKPVYCNDCFENDSRPRRDHRGGDRGRPEMHRTKCAECGNNCEVPFKPTGDKPVYCSDCFGKDSKSGSGKSNQSGQVLEDISWKLDEVILLLKQMVPNKEKPLEEHDGGILIKPKTAKKAVKKPAKKVAKTATKKATAKKAVKKTAAKAKKKTSKKA